MCVCVCVCVYSEFVACPPLPRMRIRRLFSDSGGAGAAGADNGTSCPGKVPDGRVGDGDGTLLAPPAEESARPKASSTRAPSCRGAVFSRCSKSSSVA